MEFQQLKLFLAVAEALHFGRAAQQVGMAQPHLSRAIVRLEDEIGVRLFDRTSRRVALTAAGECLREEAIALLQAQRRAHETTRAVGQQRRCLRIAYVSAALYLALPAALRTLSGGQERVEFALQEATTNEQLSLLAAGEIDLGIGHPPFETHARLDSLLLSNDRFDAVLPADHRLANRDATPFAELAGEPLVLFPEAQGPALYAAIRDRCRVAGHAMRVAATAPRLHGQLSLVAAGLGIGLAPTQSRSLSVAGTVRMPIQPYPAALVLTLKALYDPRSRHPALPLALTALRRGVAAGKRSRRYAE
ncbi:LysR substrate-binding domain-containing protein [Cupriavidus alkaliphilus]|uniref:LysR substrate-binding domain-containing protein n=1 Tax=Cupriavidus alkaliphilus TaxID=942866 RepID=UPI00160860F8|nr:LysR substrate-binding domain-containing protein [Cupriavidus alkaliphilus]MBB2919451.1 DNA-binding transcriptional LysR family regulator [Cupriavidus alkaliphilus]